MLTGEGLYNVFYSELSQTFSKDVFDINSQGQGTSQRFIKALCNSIVKYIKANATVETDVITKVIGSLGEGTGKGKGIGKVI
jgi:hypothetical protein